MKRKFNTTGACIPHLHYMVDISKKLNIIEGMVENGEYFVINRPRQYGKTTTMYMLEQKLKEEYLILSISFEGVGDKIFESESEFSVSFLRILARAAKYQDKGISKHILELTSDVNNLESLSDALTDLVEESKKEVVLLIDEVDKSSNNQLFLSFLGMLRNKFLLRQQGKDNTFHDEEFFKLMLRDKNNKDVSVLMFYLNEFTKHKNSGAIVKLNNEKTIKTLENLGFTWFKITDEYINLFNRIVLR